MAEFYGAIQGNRGEATRMGSKASGFRASCQSWQGSVITTMDEARTDDVVVVTLSVAGGSSGYYGRQMLSMPVADLYKKINAGYELRLVKPRRKRV